MLHAHTNTFQEIHLKKVALMSAPDTDKILSLVSKTVVASVIGLGVNYLGSLGAKISEVNTNLVEFKTELKTELKGVTIHQDEINKTFKEEITTLKQQMEKIQERLNK